MSSAAQSTIIGAGVGAGLMLLFDPSRGGQRRAFVRGKLVRIVQRRGAVSDREICARVRAELGRAASRPNSITVSCRKGCVTLAGDVLGTDAPSIAAAVSKVPGVHSVRNQMTFHARAIPRRRRSRLRAWTARLSPARATLLWLGAGTAVLAVTAGLRHAPRWPRRRVGLG